MNNSLDKIALDLVVEIVLERLETTDHRICCFFSDVTQCDAAEERPWFISCSDLLPHLSLKVCFICISILVILLNIFSSLLFVVQIMGEFHPNTIIPLFLSTNEILCAVYLCIIWATDIVYRGIFFLVEKEWQSSIVCHLAGHIFFFFNTADPTLLLLLSLCRLMVVLHPVDSLFKTTDFVLKLTFQTLVSLMLISAVSSHFTWNNLSSLCMKFVDPTNSNWAIRVFTILTALFQLTISVAIAVMYVLLLKELRESKHPVWMSSSKLKMTKSLVVQLVVITASNILCWVPTSTIYLTALVLPTYPSEMVIWTAVAVAPANCIINPSVFIWTSVRAILRKKRDQSKTRQVSIIWTIHHFVALHCG